MKKALFKFTFATKNHCLLFSFKKTMCNKFQSCVGFEDWKIVRLITSNNEKNPHLLIENHLKLFVICQQKGTTI